ncbi:unnamed protein product [Euphydryas editha]|uniref:Uncharacterized protein n=1 Tax=Euphydryas editha TaxID=104508 RepID=A0AAU9TFY2_EUPED|nr:unnamed protein product [Euphydryas editha]
MNLSEEQFERLLLRIGSQQRGSFATCRVSFDGAKYTETVEAFLTAVTVFKSMEKIGDEEAILSMPLVLKGEAAVWWNGIKDQVTSWVDFQARIRHAFAPKKPAFLIYQDIIGIKQEENELTEIFVAKKRALFAQLPDPAHLEAQQLDMVYGQLRVKLRSKIPRNSISSFDDLLKAARAMERLLIEKQPRNTHSEATKEPPKNNPNPVSKKVRCGYCRFAGHTTDVCRKKEREQGKSKMKAENASRPTPVQGQKEGATTQAPTPSQPKFTCYGCGTPGVVRSKCPTCAKTLISNKQEASFCAINVGTDSRRRPVIGISVGKIVGTAYVDSCAKTNVASNELYKCWAKQGYHFQKKQIMVTLADGGKTQREVLTVRVPIGVCDRVVPTTFIIFPEAKETRTLLGVGFIQDAGIVLNIPQMYWFFFDNPDLTYDLFLEDTDEASFAHMETTPLSSPARQELFKDMQLPPFISPLPVTPPFEAERIKLASCLDMPALISTLPVTPPNEIQKIVQPINATPNMPVSSACAAVDSHTSNSRSPDREPDLPETSVCSRSYKIIPIAPSTPPPYKRSKPLFDGHSPSFIDFIYRDAQINTHLADVNLSPYSRSLFPSDDGGDDTEIGSISVEDITMGIHDATQQVELTNILIRNEAVL